MKILFKILLAALIIYLAVLLCHLPSYLMSNDKVELNDNDDGNGNLNFLIEYTLEAGKTYYLRVRWLNQNEIGYIPVVIDKR